MNEIKLEFFSDLKQQLISAEKAEFLPAFQNFFIRAKGYNKFFGDQALPFSYDDFFSDFMLASYMGVPFFTIKFSTFGQHKYHNLNNPLGNLLTNDEYKVFAEKEHEIDSFGWGGGLTYICPPNLNREECSSIALELMTFFLCHSFLTKCPNGLVVTANLKAKIDLLLVKCGFEDVKLQNVIHNELVRNPARVMLLKEPSLYMRQVHKKYLQLVPEDKKQIGDVA